VVQKKQAFVPNISQGSVMTHLRHSEIFNDDFGTYWKLVSILVKLWAKEQCTFFTPQGLVYCATLYKCLAY